MSDSLFAEFAVPTRQEWEAALIKELKGKSLDELIQTDDEGLRLSPIADSSDLIPGFADVLSQRNAGWLTVQDYEATLKPAELGHRLKLDLSQGVDAVQLWARSIQEIQESRSLEIHADWHAVFLKDIESKNDLNILRSGTRIGFDPITLTALGLIYPELLARSIQSVGWINENHQPLLLGHLWAESGCSMVDQCTYSMAAIQHLIAKQLLRPPAIEITIGVGRRLIPEIAKLRAMRLVWERLKEHGYIPAAYQLVLHSRSVAWNLTPEYPHNNLIRLNLQGVAAVLGGTDSLCLLPYDWGTPNASSDHARRMSINLHHLMREESHLDKVADPLGGSFVVERLTQEYVRLIESGLAELDSQGGLVSLIERGELRERLHQAHLNQRARMLKGDLKFVEVNHLHTREPEVEPSEPPSHYFAVNTSGTSSLLLDPLAILREFRKKREA